MLKSLNTTTMLIIICTILQTIWALASERPFTAAQNILRTAIPKEQQDGFLRSGWIKREMGILRGYTVKSIRENTPVPTEDDSPEGTLTLPEGGVGISQKSLFPTVDDESLKATPPSTGAPVQLIIVDLSEETLEAFSLAGDSLMKAKIKASRFGIGSELGSYKTPLGQWTLNKEPEHAFGPTYRLSGDQGKERGILIHPGSLGHGTRGCIHLSWDKIKELYKLTAHQGTELRIQE